MTPRKLKNLQNSIHAAAVICGMPRPMGIDLATWNNATNALYEANEQIDGIVNGIEKGQKS